VGEATADVKKTAAYLKDEPLLIMFSTGRDSIVMTDLLMRYYPGQKELIFLYFVPNLSIKRRLITYYENRWQTTIHQQPHYGALSLKTGKKYRMGDVERGLRAKFNISWIAQGIRRDESMARRGMLAGLPHGIDERNKKVYPIADWSAKMVGAYIKQHTLPAPIEYSHGWKHDFSVPDVDGLVYLKHNFPKDYEKVIAEFPRLEDMVWERTH
jgi:phosphoadenosine phosphosulfate reductase